MKKFFKKLFSKIKYAFEYLLNVDWTSAFMLGRIPFTLQGLKWEMHITDKDPNPSIPHLHGVEDSRYKINVYTGEVFWDGKPAGVLKPKEHQKLWQDETFLKMLNKAREYYIEHHPYAKLPDYPYFVEKEDVSEIVMQTESTDYGLSLTSPIPEKRKNKRKNTKE